jgi:hypothetical protein
MSYPVEVQSPRQIPVSWPRYGYFLFAAALAFCGEVVPRSASAQQALDPAGGEWLFREGRALMKKGDFLGACPKLEESLRLDPAVGTLMNLAECEERIGRTASAWQRWGAAADQLPAKDKRRETALSRARTLEKSLARLVVKLGPNAPSNAQVTRDGVGLGEPSMGVPLPVDPGIHWIVVTAPGREGREIELRLEEGEQKTVEVEPGAPTPPSRSFARAMPASYVDTLIPPIPAESPAAPTVVAETPAPQRPLRSIAAGYLLLAGGVAALGTGTFFAAQAQMARRDARQSCQEVAGSHRCWATAAVALDQDRRWSMFADVGFAVGTVASAAGLYLLLRRPPAPSTPAPMRAMVLPEVGGGKVELAGTF